MSGMPDDTPRQYLLRTLPEAETLQFEERLLADDECADRLREAEDDLLDDCASGRLSAEEREAVERYLLNASNGVDRLRFARALAASARLEKGSDDTSPSAGRAHGGLTARTTGKWIVPFGVLLAASVAFALLIFPSSKRQVPMESQPATSARDVPLPVAPVGVPGAVNASAPYSVLLLAEVQRGADGATQVSIPSSAEQVHLQLEVADGTSTSGDVPTYRFMVRNAEGRELFVSGALAARQVAAYRIVEASVPVNSLGTGTLHVQLSRIDKGGLRPVFDWEVNLRTAATTP